YLAQEQTQVVAVAGKADLPGDERGVLADPVLVRALALENDLLELARLAFRDEQAAVPREKIAQAIRDRGDRDDLLLRGADDVVVDRRAGDDAAGRDLEVGGLVDDGRRVAGAGGDDLLARGHGRLDDARAAGHDHQAHALVLHERLRAL